MKGLTEQKTALVIGGGLAGLAASYDLARAGFRVRLFEASPLLGGLARSFPLAGHQVEQFYHFICRTDTHLVQLLHELGMSDRLKWQPTLTSFYYNGRLFPFGTPVDLLLFSAVPWLERLRFGFHILRSRYRNDWTQLDRLAAKPWLIENIGYQAYQVIWHPLLQIKFGSAYERISAAWVWHRIWRVAQSRRRLFQRETFGYIDGGSAALVNQLTSRLNNHPNVEIVTEAPVDEIIVEAGSIRGVRSKGQFFPAQAVLSTVALPLLNRLLPGQQGAYFDAVRQVEYIGVVCALFHLKCAFSRSFWMNINDPRVSFNGIIELSNLNQPLQSQGLNLLYVPFYLPASEPRYGFDDQDFYNEYRDMLKLVNPRFEDSWVMDWRIFRTPYAQAICTTGFAAQVPALRPPLSGLYVTDSAQFYPEDRTLSAAIQFGRQAAAAITEDLK